jgi:hypothetical protein
MEGTFGSRGVRNLIVVAGVAILFLAGRALPAEARPIEPSATVSLGSVAGLDPDGRSVSINLMASCPDRWAVLEARITMSQPQASGAGSFPLTCTGGLQLFTVTVLSLGAPFQLGDAQADAFVRIERGRTLTAQDSAAVRVVPNAFVDLADVAQLDGGGEAVLVEVTVACPVGTDSAAIDVSVDQGQALGHASQGVTCDGVRHAATISVRASQGLFQLGNAQGSALVNIEEAGDHIIAGEDTHQIEII